MAKNILIFSDGTGQGGGLSVDERRSNVYKLYRATRCGPDSAVDPARQLAFYDPGLGSRRAGGEEVSLFRKVYNVLSQATGLGLTHNIVDCYAAIVRMWEPGDRIYLFGFSRGAYTVRCLSGVLNLCGVPTTASSEVTYDADTVQRIAVEAVKGVYQYGNDVAGDPLKTERLERAAAFRARYASAGSDGETNVAPYLIGVWDTVAALGFPLNGPPLWVATALIVGVTIAISAGLLRLVGWVASSVWPSLDVGYVPLFWACVVASIVGGAALAFAKLAYPPPKGGTSTRRGWVFGRPSRIRFYDQVLGARVAFARHALAIDENRRDFARVPWTSAPRAPGVPGAPERLKQVWFAGCHSDVGGSYDETEARLSDISLEWMVAEAMSLPEPIVVDRGYLRMFPSAAGHQHDEAKAGFAGLPSWLRRFVRWDVHDRPIQRDAPLHPSVIERFDLPSVRVYDVTGPYRPKSLAGHDEVRKRYQPVPEDDDVPSNGLNHAPEPAPRSPPLR